MNAGQYLIANSSLASGTAAQHLLNQILGGGSTGLIVNDGIDVEVSLMALDVELDDQTIEVSIDTEVIELEVNDNTITVEVDEW